MIARVLALDLSYTATGIAHPNGTTTTWWPPNRGDQRLNDAYHCVHRLLEPVTPTLVALEGPVTRSQAATASGMLHGAVRLALMHYTVPYIVIPPATLKTYATGRGNAPKPDLRMELYKRAGIDLPDDNQVDAYWLRLLTLDLLGEPELHLPQTHRRALAKLTLPEPPEPP
jgi:hypothetical protein